MSSGNSTRGTYGSKGALEGPETEPDVVTDGDALGGHLVPIREGERGALRRQPPHPTATRHSSETSTPAPRATSPLSPSASPSTTSTWRAVTVQRT